MKGFEVFEHTSDLGVVARGSTLEETLACLLRGVFATIADVSGVRPDREWTIAAAGDDLEGATVRLVNEALFVHDTEGALCSGVVVTVKYPGDRAPVEIEARCSGEALDPARHSVRRYVKAATYHGIRVTPREIRLILDV